MRPGIPVTVFPVRSLRRPSAIAGARQLACYLKRQKIRIAHAFDVPMDLFAAPTARLAGTPVVISSRHAFSHLTPGVHRRLLRLADRLAHGIVVNGEGIRRHLIEDESVPEQKLYLCYNSADYNEFAPREGRRPLIRAFAQSRPPHWRLMIVGSGPCLTELEGCPAIAPWRKPFGSIQPLNGCPPGCARSTSSCCLLFLRRPPTPLWKPWRVDVLSWRLASEAIRNW